MEKKQKKEQTIKIEETPTSFDDQLDVTKFILEVHSNIKENVSPDFIMASLSEKDKEFITEMVQNAHFNRQIIVDIAKKLPEGQEKQKVKQIATDLFEEHILKTFMIAILNRNRKDNWLVGKAIGQEPEEPQEEQDTGKILQGLKNIFQKEKQEQE